MDSNLTKNAKSSIKMNMDDKYEVVFNNNKYYFDLMKIGEHSAIAVFDALSSFTMAKDCCEDMKKILAENGIVKGSFDTIVTAESKAVTLGAILASYYGSDLVILRKKVRNFFKEVISEPVTTYTTTASSYLNLDYTHNKQYLENKKVLLLDDVVSTGSSLTAMEKIMNKVNAKVIAKAFIFSEGDVEREKDVYFVHKLPIIEVD